MGIMSLGQMGVQGSLLACVCTSDKMRIFHTHKPHTFMTTTERTAQASRSSRQPTNLTIDSTVLSEAKALGINISRACEAHLQEMVRQEKTRLWKEQHAKFLAHYNAEVERDGLPLYQWRQL